ncbi:MAG: phosphoadenylyl-sulfate reductase [Myxococcota bacterium]
MEASPLLDSNAIDDANVELGDVDAETLIGWAAETFGDGLVLSSSFGAHSAVMLHLVSRVAPQTPVIFVDTGYLFPETYRFAAELERRFGLNLKVYGPTMTPARQEALYGQLWEQGDEGVQEYLKRNKVEPMERALRELGTTGWMAGLRARQTEHRAQLRRIDVQNGRVKIHPILKWSMEDVEAYLDEHELPYHPLYADGFRSIGDVHSTLPTTADMDPRDGRILGKKRECGIHLPLSAEENKSLTSSGL